MSLRLFTDRETPAGQLVIISMRRPATIGGKFAGTPRVPVPVMQVLRKCGRLIAAANKLQLFSNGVSVDISAASTSPFADCFFNVSVSALPVRAFPVRRWCHKLSQTACVCVCVSVCTCVLVRICVQIFHLHNQTRQIQACSSHTLNWLYKCMTGNVCVCAYYC